MASHKFSFTFIAPLAYDNGRTARAEAATTASVYVDPVTACEPPLRFSATVGMLSKLKRKEPLATSSHDTNLSTLHNARVTIPVCAIGCLPTYSVTVIVTLQCNTVTTYSVTVIVTNCFGGVGWTSAGRLENVLRGSCPSRWSKHPARVHKLPGRISTERSKESAARTAVWHLWSLYWM